MLMMCVAMYQHTVRNHVATFGIAGTNHVATAVVVFLIGESMRFGLEMLRAYRLIIGSYVLDVMYEPRHACAIAANNLELNCGSMNAGH